MRRMFAVAAVLLLSVAAEPVTLRSLFSKEADVYADGPGLARLDLPPEVVADCLSNLADVRLFDLDGNEVPFLLDSPRVEKVFDSERVEVRPNEVLRDEVPRDKGPSLRRETYELTGPTTAPRGGEWNLVAEIAHPEFVVRARVTWIRQDGATPRVTTGSLFRLTSPRRVEKLALPLGPTAFDRVVVVLEHEQPFWIEPSFRFESARTIERSGRATIPLSVLSTKSANGTTVVELARPRGVVPATLRVSSSTGSFDRTFTVNDAGPAHDPATLGSARLFRLIPDSGVEDLELPLRLARGDRLRIAIDDGDSPPLAGLVFTAVFGQPSLVAALSGAGGAAPVATLRFGGGRANVPRYDLAGFRPEPGREVYGKRAEALLRLYDPAAILVARLGPIRPNPGFDRTPALAFAMRPGASIDTRAFVRQRKLDVQPSPEGLSRVRLGADDLAVLRADLADLRIVDSASRQWPYLVERGDATIGIPLAIAATSRSRATTYDLSAAVSPVTVDRLSIDTDVPFFDRRFRLTATNEDDKQTEVAQGRFARSAGDPMPVTLDFGAVRATKLELRIEDGDDAPLAFGSVLARSAVPEIFIAAPAGAYTMYLGAADAPRPSYELERVRDVVLSVAAAEIQPHPIEKNAGYKLSARLTQGDGPGQALLWVALIAAVVILAVLTLKLARQKPSV